MDAQLKLDAGRSTRLWGANIFFDDPGAVLDVHIINDQEQLINLWQLRLSQLLTMVGWISDYKRGYKIYSKGIRFAISAPIDLLWVATEVLEHVWYMVRYEFELQQQADINEAMLVLLPKIKENTNLAYREVYAIAKQNKLNIFDDGKQIGIGSGKHIFIVNKSELADAVIPWAQIKNIPCVMVTGTNGKTTTVRLTRYINMQRGSNVGYCSTDWVMIGNEILEKGDFSGPSGNAAVMMSPEVDVAVLEVARGGLLRRGILTNYIQGATVTNISDDHLGEDGVDTVEELAVAKCLVFKALSTDGYAVINLDDVNLRSIILELPLMKKICITRNITDVSIQPFLRDASYVCFTLDDAFYWRDSKGVYQKLASFNQVPLTISGYANHNIENAMHAIALSFSLGCSLEHISQCLIEYENTYENNQGRTNVFRYNNATIIVDFAHNLAGITAILNLARAYLRDGSKLGLLFGSTGNRMYMLESIAKVIISSGVNKVILKELANYLRGTKPGELVGNMFKLLLSQGMQEQNITIVKSEHEALEQVFKFIQSGDVFVFCAHENTAEIINTINKTLSPGERNMAYNIQDLKKTVI